jgi:hypothetical protein
MTARTGVQDILRSLGSDDVGTVCDALALFRERHKAGTYTASMSWADAWKDIVVLSDPSGGADARVARKLAAMHPVLACLRRRGASADRVGHLVPSKRSCLKLLSLRCFTAMSTPRKVCVLVVASKRGVLRDDEEGYAAVCIDVASTILGKRLCYDPWHVDAVPDREFEPINVSVKKRRLSADVDSAGIGALIDSLALLLT